MFDKPLDIPYKDDYEDGLCLNSFTEKTSRWAVSSRWSLKENAYGVTIYEKLREMGKHRANWGAMYLTLKRLDNKKYIQSRTGEPTRARGGRSKKCRRDCWKANCSVTRKARLPARTP